MNGFDLQQIYSLIALITEIDSISFRTFKLGKYNNLVVTISRGVFKFEQIFSQFEANLSILDYVSVKSIEMAHRFDKEIEKMSITTN